jgi:nitrogen fixation/metabolism regulation signal transduction histidine kinase
VANSSFPPVFIFIAWVALLSLVIAGLMVYRWRRPDRHSRFQLKLTLALILCLLIPTVPLLFVTGMMVDQAKEFLISLPVVDALEQGLTALRVSLQDEEARLSTWRDAVLNGGWGGGTGETGPDFSLRYEKSADGAWGPADVRVFTTSGPVPADSIRAVPPDPRTQLPDALTEAEFTQDELVLFNYRNRGVYMALVRPVNADHLEAAGVWIASQLVDARYSIDEGRGNFSTVGRLSVAAGQITWMLASLWLVVLTVAAFLTSRALARGVSQPVIELANGMEKVASGNLGTRLPVTARDEMRVLVESFNAMTDQLQDARERIVAAEKQAAWRDVARRIAHEIKNPLTPLQLGLHRVRTRLQSEGIWGSDAGLRESIDTMNSEVEALRRMAASFSDFAELPQPRMSPADIEDVVRGAAALFQEGAHRGSLSVAVQGHIPSVQMDADLVKRAVINLIKNAVESVDEAGGGQVEVLLEQRSKQLVLEIRDNGTGFDPDVAGQMFDPDFTTKSRGTGLGLSVVSRIISEHGWSIRAESDGPNQGASVLLTIPVGEGIAP